MHSRALGTTNLLSLGSVVDRLCAKYSAAVRRAATLLACVLWWAFSDNAHAEQLRYISRQSPSQILQECDKRLEPIGVICISGKDWGAYAHPSDDLSSSTKYRELYRLAQAYDHAGVAALALSTRPRDELVYAFADIYTQYLPYTTTPVTHIDVSVQVYRGDSFFQSDDAKTYVDQIVRTLPVLPHDSAAAKDYLANLDIARQTDQQHRRQQAQADHERTNPHCSTVVVNGVVSAGSVYQLEHALQSAEIEDTIARNPITCGGPSGCYGVAHLEGRKARIIDWDPNYYILSAPIDFTIGRRDINVYVRRSDTQCVTSMSPMPQHG